MAELSYLPHAHIGIANNSLQSLLALHRSRETSDSKPLALDMARRLDSGPDGFGGLSHSISTQLFVINSGDFDMDIDTIKQRTGDPFLILRDKRMSAAARLLGVPIITTRAGIHGSD